MLCLKWTAVCVQNPHFVYETTVYETTVTLMFILLVIAGDEL